MTLFNTHVSFGYTFVRHGSQKMFPGEAMGDENLYSLHADMPVNIIIIYNIINNKFITIF